MALFGWAKTRQRNAHNRTGREGREFLSFLYETGRFCTISRDGSDGLIFASLGLSRSRLSGHLGWRVRRFSITFRNVLERHR